MDRRDALRLGAGTVAATLAGCSALGNGPDEGSGSSQDGGSGSSQDRGSDSAAWSTFRGDPARSGVRPASAGPGESLSVAWSIEPPVPDGAASNWFAPEVDGERLYVPALINDGLGLAVYDPATGEEQDRLDLGLAFLSGQPLVAGGMVYVRDSDREGATLRAFDASDGTERWAVGASPPESGWPGVSVTDGAVWTFDRRDGQAFIARETADGNVRVQTPLPDLPRSLVANAPAPLAPPTVVDGGVYAAEGSLEWAVPLPSSTFAPVAAGDVLYAATSEGVTAVSADGELLDTLSMEGLLVEYSPALGAGRLFVSTLRGVAAVE